MKSPRCAFPAPSLAATILAAAISPTIGCGGGDSAGPAPTAEEVAERRKFKEDGLKHLIQSGKENPGAKSAKGGRRPLPR